MSKNDIVVYGGLAYNQDGSSSGSSDFEKEYPIETAWIKDQKNTVWSYAPSFSSDIYNFNYSTVIKDDPNYNKCYLEAYPYVSGDINGSPWIVESNYTDEIKRYIDTFSSFLYSTIYSTEGKIDISIYKVYQVPNKSGDLDGSTVIILCSFITPTYDSLSDKFSDGSVLYKVILMRKTYSIDPK